MMSSIGYIWTIKQNYVCDQEPFSEGDSTYAYLWSMMVTQ
jgi:hypothetical protein